MGFLQKLNGTLQNWLFKEEIAITEQRKAEGLPVTLEEFETERKAEFEKMERITKAEMTKIMSEDHSQRPCDADVNRYFTYHENFVHNMKGLEDHIEGLWTKAPKTTIRFEDYVDEAKNNGWDYLRTSCGMPSGDLNKPRTPWITGHKGANWNTSKIEEQEPVKPKTRKRGI